MNPEEGVSASRTESWPWVREIVLDRHDPTPPVEQLAHAIRNKIAMGRIRANDTLPSVRAMAALVGVTPATVARAYQVLQREGLLATPAGQGTIVVDIENLQQSAKMGMLDAAKTVIDRAVQAVTALGLNESEVKELLRTQRERLVAPTRRLVFIARHHTNLALYERQLSDATSGLPVSVTILPLEALENGDEEAFDTVSKAEFVASLVTYKRLISALLPSSVDVRYIIADISTEAAEALSALPPDADVTLVATLGFRTVGYGILHTYCPPERITLVRDDDSDAAWSQVPRDSVVVYTYRLRERAERLVPDHQRICLDFELRSDSMERLRAFLVAATQDTLPAAKPLDRSRSARTS